MLYILSFLVHTTPCQGVVWIWDLGKMVLASLLCHNSRVKSLVWDPMATGDRSRLAISFLARYRWMKMGTMSPGLCRLEGQLLGSIPFFGAAPCVSRPTSCHQQHGVPVPIGSTASEALQTRCCFCGRHSTRKPCPAPCPRRGCDGVRMDAAAWHRLCRLAPQPGSSRWLGKFRQSLTMKKV